MTGMGAPKHADWRIIGWGLIILAVLLLMAVSVGHG